MWKYREKNLLLDTMSLYCVIHKSKAAIDQFIDGLNSIGSLMSQLKNHPLLFKELFCANSGNLSINEFRQLCKINFSQVGCNDRSGEEKSILWWEEMLDNLSQKEEVDGISLKELLTFVTGADEVPPAGFPKLIDIDFYYQPLDSRGQVLRRLPHASTCALQLYLPRNVPDYEEMKNLLRESLHGCQGFGKV
jgi:hypothetical protein